MIKVFIDGSAGTTGLNIFSRLKSRTDISLITLDETVRKDVSARKDAISSSDVTFLCLPDEAAKESVSLCDSKDTVIIDTSTAHRLSPDFVYGFLEKRSAFLIVRFAARAITVDTEQSVEEVYDLPEKL